MTSSLPPRPLILFDYDDTLFPSSEMAQRGLSLHSGRDSVDPELYRLLREHEAGVKELLTKSKRIGDVCIVTNAEEGWVQMSAEKFLPGIAEHIHDMPVISARTQFERQTASPVEWKLFAFRNLIKARAHQWGYQQHVISFGDSHAERWAAKHTSIDFNGSLVKTVKFREKPTLVQLSRQIQLITSQMETVIVHQGELDLELTIDQPQPREASPSRYIDMAEETMSSKVPDAGYQHFNQHGPVAAAFVHVAVGALQAAAASAAAAAAAAAAVGSFTSEDSMLIAGQA
jgi:hypothetical protein